MEPTFPVLRGSVRNGSSPNPLRIRTVPRLGTSGKERDAKGLLLDMGYYEWTAVDPGLQTPGRPSLTTAQYIHLMQVVPASVAARTLTFAWPLPLSSAWEQVVPGFFDAPSARRVQLPGMRELLDSGDASGALARPTVTIAFSSIEGYKEILAYNAEVRRAGQAVDIRGRVGSGLASEGF